MRHVTEQKWVINAHRGAFHEGFVENTIPAYIQSYKEGANCFETDLHLTKDNQILLLHNDDINGIMKFATKIPDNTEFNEAPTGLIRTHTASYMKAITFPNNSKILTLNEFLHFLQKLKVGANIEMKEGGYEDLILKYMENAQLSYEEFMRPVVITSGKIKPLFHLAKNTV
jgi:glycerophosphoryl diester phosphodiesterase